MLKLNQNYSDYTDETDENYPEGKAINASSSKHKYSNIDNLSSSYCR